MKSVGSLSCGGASCRSVVSALILLVGLFWMPRGVLAQETKPAVEVTESRGEIVIDGDLSDAGWQGAVQLGEWFETNPGDNLPPKVGSEGYLTYDDEFFYVGLRFDDPEPSKIRAPLGDRDNVPPYTDYGGVIIDTNGDGTTAQMFLANPRGIQYDALSSDASGEDSAPDFFWESAGRVTEAGWILEIKVPFSSLRYSQAEDQRWNIMLYRNRPRDYRYQMFSTRLPRDTSCFICNAQPLAGLRGLPSGSHWVVAPYLSGSGVESATDGPGTPLGESSSDTEVGLDARWIPNPNTVVDLTYNPDFSQIESDVPQLATNERFALFFDEQRPFFLEGADLFSTPIDALYTRTFTSPRWGLRTTGTAGKHSYTVLVGEDRGGGSVIIPGTLGSSLAEQDFESQVVLARWKREVGDGNHVSVLYSGRELDGGGHNRVLGPDVRWRPSKSDTVVGQALLSWSETPNRLDLADEWNGQDLSGHAGEFYWEHDAEKVDWFLKYEEVSEDFRADNGFVPQVGYREAFAETGYTFRPQESRIKRFRIYAFTSRSEDLKGELIESYWSPGFAFDGPLSSWVRIRGSFEKVQSGGKHFDRNRLVYVADLRPSRRISRIFIEGDYGDQIDHANHRQGSGGSIGLRGNFRATDHLDFQLNTVREWLDVDEAGLQGRLFTAELTRLKATYNFSARAYLRLIGQWTDTERDPDLYISEVSPARGDLTGSLLFAYKINWQTVLFVGVGELQQDSDLGRSEPVQRTAFVKLSYAFQR